MKTVEELIHSLPKYIRDAKTANNLVIIKKDLDQTYPNSYQVFYAKRTKYGYSVCKPLLYAQGRTLLDALQEMDNKLTEYYDIQREKQKAGLI
jgi:hypothetical protein